MDVIFYEAFKEEEEQIKRFLPEHISAGFSSHTIQEAKDKNPPAAIISIRTQSEIPLEWADKIKGILARSQGYDHLLVYKKETGGNIPCGYIEEYCSRAVAEHAILLMLSLMRKEKLQLNHFRTFNRDNLTGYQAKGKNVLIVGVGKIGSQIADLAHGLRMEVKGVDIEEKLEALSYFGLDEGISWADVIFCTLPLTDATKGLLGYNKLRAAKKGIFLINIARGEITPVEDLEKLLKENILAGIGLDVYPNEGNLANCLRGNSCAANDELKSYIEKILTLSEKENVLFTPHNAFNTKEALEQKALLSIKSVEAFKKKGEFLYPV